MYTPDTRVVRAPSLCARRRARATADAAPDIMLSMPCDRRSRFRVIFARYVLRVIARLSPRCFTPVSTRYCRFVAPATLRHIDDAARRRLRHQLRYAISLFRRTPYICQMPSDYACLPPALQDAAMKMLDAALFAFVFCQR